MREGKREVCSMMPKFDLRSFLLIIILGIGATFAVEPERVVPEDFTRIVAYLGLCVVIWTAMVIGHDRGKKR